MINTEVGKFLKILRIRNDERLYDMAKKLNVSSAFLSSVETGKRNMPESWYEKIIELYSLNEDEASQLKTALYLSKNKVTLSLENASRAQLDVVLSLARKFKSLDDGDARRIKNILDKGE